MKKYKVILADPPWRYSNSGIEGAAEKQYPTMSDNEIMTLKIPADESAVLFLWATWPKLDIAMRVIKSWGFVYKSGLPWVKIQRDPTIDLFGELDIKPSWGIGFWINGVSEPILIATKGKASPPDNPYVGLLCERMRHSRKPENIYHIAETLPGPYLELFTRRPRDGWDSWGNEIDSDIELKGRNE